jgi:AhpD family alkylhydroperoxidase
MSTIELASVGRRIDLRRATPRAYRAMAALDREAWELGLDERLGELIRMRASYVNRCAYCIQLHAADARRIGEDERRLCALAAWPDSPYFDERERVALALTDALTDLGPERRFDPAYEAARGTFADAELAAALWAIVAINAWNRIAIVMGLTPPALQDHP